MHGAGVFAAVLLVLVLAGAAGLGLAVVRDGLAARRAERRGQR